MVDLGRRDTRSLEQRQHGVVAAFTARRKRAHGRHVEVGALEEGLQVAPLEDEAVDAEGEGQGDEQHDGDGCKPEA